MIQDDRLLFSIVIPTYNRKRQLTRCLRGLNRLEYPRDRFEVVIVDDGGDQPLGDTIENLADNLRVVLLRQLNAGPASARNTGARRARGRFVVFMDDDCAPAPDLLHALSRQFEKTPECLLGGKIINALPGNPWSAASQLLLDYLYDYFNSDRSGATFLASMNIAMPCRLFLRVGGFDTQFSGAGGEDREFCVRWLSAGLPMRYTPRPTIYHFHDMTLRSFWRQHFNYGKGAYRFHQRRRALAGDRFRIEPLSFYTGLAQRCVRSAPFPRSLSMLALIWMSQKANALGYCRARFQRAGRKAKAGPQS